MVFLRFSLGFSIKLIGTTSYPRWTPLSSEDPPTCFFLSAASGDVCLGHGGRALVSTTVILSCIFTSLIWYTVYVMHGSKFIRDITWYNHWNIWEIMGVEIHTDWWFGTFFHFLFFYWEFMSFIIRTDELIFFQRGGSTTNQLQTITIQGGGPCFAKLGCTSNY